VNISQEVTSSARPIETQKQWRHCQGVSEKKSILILSYIVGPKKVKRRKKGRMKETKISKRKRKNNENKDKER
jgi:hypothetical protein